MLRHPAETLTSARKSYGATLTTASRAAAWANVALETELATRGSRRAFIRYDDLLADWRREIARLGERIAMPEIVSPDAGRAAGVDGFVDPTLHRNRVRWDDLDAAGPGARCARWPRRAWERLQPLATEGDDAGDAGRAGRQPRRLRHALRRGGGDRPVLGPGRPPAAPAGTAGPRPPRRADAVRPPRPPRAGPLPQARPPAAARVDRHAARQRRRPDLQRRDLPRAVPRVARRPDVHRPRGRDGQRRLDRPQPGDRRGVLRPATRASSSSTRRTAA